MIKYIIAVVTHPRAFVRGFINAFKAPVAPPTRVIMEITEADRKEICRILDEK